MSQYLGMEPSLLEDYGAFHVRVASDLPLFIDPFLPFHSDKPDCQALHEFIVDTSASCATALQVIDSIPA